MFWKKTGRQYIVSQDGRRELFSFAVKDFADIAYACAWPGSGTILLTAAQSEADCASVKENYKGNYRAYSLSIKGIKKLTNEYTNTAILLPDGMAYSNGSALVTIRDNKRAVYKVGRFNWGPTSLSCNEQGTRVGMTKWKGDHRKLAFADVGSDTLTLSRFSLYSYLLMSDDIYYVLRGDVMSFSPSVGRAYSITPRSVRRTLLGAVGIDPAQASAVDISFQDICLFENRPVATAYIRATKSYERLWYGIVKLPYQDLPMDVLVPIEEPWKVRHLASTGDTLYMALKRYESACVVETRITAFGGDTEPLSQGWRPFSHPRVPEHGFQFLP